MSKRTIILALAVLGLVACAAGNGSAAKTAFSPCTSVRLAVWSPDGTQIAFYATRWPRPKAAATVNDMLQGFCTMDGSGGNAQPLRYTVCNEKCADLPYQIAWLKSGDIVYDIDGGPLYRLTPGQKPKRFATVNSPSFATDTAGDRLAAGWGFPGCLSCRGPVTVLDIASGHVVGKVGGNKFQNMDPSLSPDGSQVVFDRFSSSGPARTFGIWTAKASGTGLRQLVRQGAQPLWSPAGDEIAYRTSATPTGGLHLVGAHGGKAKTLVARGVTTLFGWSPDGKYIAYESGSGTFGKLTVVDAATGKVSQLTKLYYSPTVDWAPDSQELLVATAPDPKKCSSVLRVPLSGGKPTVIHHC